MEERKLKVVRIIARLNIGGPAIQAITLTSRLNPMRYSSILVSGVEAPHEGNMLSLALKEGVQPVIIPSLGRELSPLRDLFTLLRLVLLIRREKPDIVHTHTAKAGFLGRIAAHLARVPVIVHTYHGHVLRGYFGFVRTRLFRRLERLAARYTDKIVAVSPLQRRELLSFRVGHAEQIVVIPLGFDLDRFPAAAAMAAAAGQGEGRDPIREAMGVPAGVQVVGIVARLTAIKNVARFLEAADYARKSGSQAIFLIVGDGEERTRLERKASQLGLGDSVRFLGWREDLERLYPVMDVVALSSDNEGTPVTLIEAMAAGRPVVSTAVGGVPDVVVNEVTGLLVDVGYPRPRSDEDGGRDTEGEGRDEQGDFLAGGDAEASPPAALNRGAGRLWAGDGGAEALGAAIARLLSDPELRRRLGQAGQKQVLRRFSFERLRGDIEELYLELLQEKSIVD